MPDETKRPIPDRVWIQFGEPDEDGCVVVTDETTWCRDSINPDDVAYVRGDRETPSPTTPTNPPPPGRLLQRLRDIQLMPDEFQVFASELHMAADDTVVDDDLISMPAFKVRAIADLLQKVANAVASRETPSNQPTTPAQPPTQPQPPEDGQTICIYGCSDDIVHVTGFDPTTGKIGGSEGDETYRGSDADGTPWSVTIAYGDVRVEVSALYLGYWGFVVGPGHGDFDDLPDWPVRRTFGADCGYSETIEIDIPAGAWIQRVHCSDPKEFAAP